MVWEWSVKFNPTGLKRMKYCPSSEMEIDFAGIWERSWPNAQRSVVDIWRSLVKFQWAKWMNVSSTPSANTHRVALSKTFSLRQENTMPEMWCRLFWSLRNVAEMRCVLLHKGSVFFFFLTWHSSTQKWIFSHYLLSLMLTESQVKLFLELQSTAVLQHSPQQLK